MTTLNAITFTDDLQWVDEFQWAPVVQSTERSITGAALIQNALRTGARPITLAADSDEVGWFTRGQLEGLYSLASLPGEVMTLTYRGVTRAVIFDQSNTAIDPRPVVPFADVQPGDYYHVTLRFLTV